MRGLTGGREPLEKIESGTTITLQREPEKEKERQSRFLLSEPKYCFDDIVLQPQQRKAIEELLALAEYHDQIYHTWGLEKVIRRGKGLKVNLYGEPGTGKTMAAHAIACALKKQIVEVSYAEIESKYVGETSKNLVALFREAGLNGSVLLFDEADALLSKRVTEMHSSSDVSVNQTRSVLLKILDEYEGICLFTTNFLQNYDPAFMRRMTRQIFFGLPDKFQRERLWQHYLVPELPVNVDIGDLAEKRAGLSGADIANAVLNAAIRAASERVTVIPQSFFESAADDLLAARKAHSTDQPLEAGMILNTEKQSVEG